MATTMCGDSGDRPDEAAAPVDVHQQPLPAMPWQVLGASVPGASHLRLGLPNQDAIGWRALRQGGFVVCVSDGHGSSRYFRSDVGSRLAVEVGATYIQAFVDRYEEKSPEEGEGLGIVEDEAGNRLPRDIVLAWRKACLAHAAENPLPAEDSESSTEAKASLRDAAKEEDPEGPNEVGGPPRNAAGEESLPEPTAPEVPLDAYGATFLAVVVCPLFVLYLQLGDGDIVTLEQGVADFALPRDPRLLANETTSLCGKNAWKDFRVRLDVFRPTRPELILVATDGYSNSFAADQDFLQVAADLWQALRQQGVDFVGRSLPEWLAESSQLGSGDDVSLGLLFRVPVGEPDLTAREESDARGEVAP